MIISILIAAFVQTAAAMTVIDDAGKFVEMECVSRPASTAIDNSLRNHLTGITELTAGSEAGDPEFALKNSFWQARTSEGSLSTVECDGRTHVVFDVFRPEENEAVATVAVANAGVFRYSQTHTEPEAEALIAAQRQPAQSMTDGVSAAVEGSMDYVICTDSSELNVRDGSLAKVLFQAKRHESVKPVQSFGTDEMKKTIGGQTYTFTKIQVPSRTAGVNTGWIAEDYLKLRSQCAGATVQAPIARAGTWTFPTNKRATTSYKSGMRKFKAGRSGGRLHAACDIYRVKNEAAVAVSSGTVIRDRYYFYQGTYALEVKHSDGKVVRYGEITGTAATGTKSGNAVTTGQTIGYIGKVNSNCCEPMLHFEMYSGSATGSLTQSGNSFQRRKDLIDPSTFLTDWEKAKFGTAY